MPTQLSALIATFPTATFAQDRESVQSVQQVLPSIPVESIVLPAM
jgi:hypothetical protein